uniref:Uncharacterized protein n=1 Tax=Micrurus surinamensis TaxID=129470 RepID=A0A2D4PBX9_MICSU
MYSQNWQALIKAFEEGKNGLNRTSTRQEIRNIFLRLKDPNKKTLRLPNVGKTDCRSPLIIHNRTHPVKNHTNVWSATKTFLGKASSRFMEERILQKSPTIAPNVAKDLAFIPI